HPYSRLFICYSVIFCNFLIFAEDPLSHSLKECSIPILGNIISMLFTKYPHRSWLLFSVKISMNIIAIIIGLIFGKYFLHNIVLRRVLRLKMFRDESGTWMIMLLSMLLSLFLISHLYNTLLLMLNPFDRNLLITSNMGISYASFMKIAACGTWCGDFFTAWMITDMMLQDNLYPNWAKSTRRFWLRHTNIRILVFWSGSLVIAAIVILIILNDVICWDCINRGWISTTEITRAFLASAILVMDLLIVMQDWDFPHFVCDLNIKLPGLLQPSYTFEFFHKSLKFPAIDIKISGKWFNYGIIVFVMMLDLNMWKNQIIYYPLDYGQYVGPKSKVISITDQSSIETMSKWSFELRKRMINLETNRTFFEDDLKIEARYTGSAWIIKATSLIPILIVYIYGRFPPKTDISLGGRLPKRNSTQFRSSWRRERREEGRSARIDWPGITIYENEEEDFNKRFFGVLNSTMIKARQTNNKFNFSKFFQRILERIHSIFLPKNLNLKNSKKSSSCNQRDFIGCTVNNNCAIPMMMKECLLVQSIPMRNIDEQSQLNT
ncbi:THEM117 domain containing protein, partial [Sarcoptes scabiei]